MNANPNHARLEVLARKLRRRHPGEAMGYLDAIVRARLEQEGRSCTGLALPRVLARELVQRSNARG